MTDVPEPPRSVEPEIELRNDGGSGTSSLPGSPLLSIRGLTKHFGPVGALRYCDLDVPAGVVTALIGDNGAGKSTLIKAIAGIYAPSSGQIFWEGKEVQIHTLAMPMNSAFQLCIKTWHSVTIST